eukprot:GILK01007717.1.p1 GENE.GILK01007717.1~~GILK01007717.1.p1  ORF type:complete len:1271 (+),score=145.32 GILK01007717.1:41-3814(+)
MEPIDIHFNVAVKALVCYRPLQCNQYTHVGHLILCHWPKKVKCGRPMKVMNLDENCKVDSLKALRCPEHLKNGKAQKKTTIGVCLKCERTFPSPASGICNQQLPDESKCCEKTCFDNVVLRIKPDGYDKPIELTCCTSCKCYYNARDSASNEDVEPLRPTQTSTYQRSNDSMDWEANMLYAQSSSHLEGSTPTQADSHYVGHGHYDNFPSGTFPPHAPGIVHDPQQSNIAHGPLTAVESLTNNSPVIETLPFEFPQDNNWGLLAITPQADSPGLESNLSAGSGYMGGAVPFSAVPIQLDEPMDLFRRAALANQESCQDFHMVDIDSMDGEGDLHARDQSATAFTSTAKYGLEDLRRKLFGFGNPAFAGELDEQNRDFVVLSIHVKNGGSEEAALKTAKVLCDEYVNKLDSQIASSHDENRRELLISIQVYILRAQQDFAEYGCLLFNLSLPDGDKERLYHSLENCRDLWPILGINGIRFGDRVSVQPLTQETQTIYQAHSAPSRSFTPCERLLALALAELSLRFLQEKRLSLSDKVFKFGFWLRKRIVSNEINQFWLKIIQEERDQFIAIVEHYDEHSVEDLDSNIVDWMMERFHDRLPLVEGYNPTSITASNPTSDNSTKKPHVDLSNDVLSGCGDADKPVTFLEGAWLGEDDQDEISGESVENQMTTLGLSDESISMPVIVDSNVHPRDLQPDTRPYAPTDANCLEADPKSSERANFKAIATSSPVSISPQLSSSLLPSEQPQDSGREIALDMLHGEEMTEQISGHAQAPGLTPIYLDSEAVSPSLLGPILTAEDAAMTINELLQSEHAVSDDSVRFVLDLMLRFQASEEVEVAVCFGLEANQRTTVVRRGGIPLVVAAMCAFPQSVNVQLLACSVFCNFGVHEENLVAMVDACAIPPIIKAMHNFPLSEDLQEFACLTLGALAGHAGTEPTVLCDAVPLVIAAMCAFSHSEQVQQSACLVLGNLARNPSNETIIVDAGAVPYVLAAMGKFPKSEQVQQRACLVLGKLMAHGQTNRVAVVCADALPYVVAAMRNFPKSKEVQESTCVFLGKLAQKSIVTMIDENVISLVVDAMRAFPESRITYWALAMFSMHDALATVCDSTIVHAGAVPLLVDAMRHFPECEETQAFTCMILGNLAQLPDNQHIVVDAGAVPYVLATMSNFPESEQVQQFACLLLGNLSELNTNQVRVVPLEAVALVQAAMNAFRQSETVQEFGRSALDNLAEPATHKGVSVGGKRFQDLKGLNIRFPKIPRAV